MAEVVVRPRRDDDVPALVEVLAEQQPTSRYPFRWPLPFPPEEFVRREHELFAYAAELDGTLVGHACVQSVAGSAGTNGVAEDELAAMWSAGHGLPPEQLAVVSSLFTATTTRGLGIGGRLLDAAVDGIRHLGLAPCLDVIVGPSPAAAIYRARGWVEVGHPRPAWLEPGYDLVAMVLRSQA